MYGLEVEVEAEVDDNADEAVYADGNGRVDDACDGDDVYGKCDDDSNDDVGGC